MRIDLKKNEWALVIDGDTGAWKIKTVDRPVEEITDEMCDNVLLSLTEALCWLEIGGWKKSQFLKFIGAVWSEMEKEEKEDKRKKQGKRND